MTHYDQPSPNFIPPYSSTKYSSKGYLHLFQRQHEDSIEANITWDNPAYRFMLFPDFDDVVSLLINNFWDQATLDDNLNHFIFLPIFTEYRRDDVVYRSHDNYHSDGPWQDWCWVQWDDSEGIAKLLIFMEDPSNKLFAIMHPCSLLTRKDHSVLSAIWSMEWIPHTRTPWLQLVPVDSLQHHALMLSYTAVALSPTDILDQWIEIYDRDSWGDQFQNFE